MLLSISSPQRRLSWHAGYARKRAVQVLMWTFFSIHVSRSVRDKFQLRAWVDARVMQVLHAAQLLHCSLYATRHARAGAIILSVRLQWVMRTRHRMRIIIGDGRFYPIANKTPQALWSLYFRAHSMHCNEYNTLNASITQRANVTARNSNLSAKNLAEWQKICINNLPFESMSIYNSSNTHFILHLLVGNW